VDELEPDDPDDPDDEELADGVVDGCWSVVVVVDELVLPWVVSAATNENIPARPTAPAIIQRLIRESSVRPRSREVWFRGEVMRRSWARPARER
jgi:hypothetical protein